MRLIDADALTEKVRCTNRYFDVKFDIDEAPTIDAEPVRHGHWVANRLCDFWGCSCCGESTFLESDYQYCPNCGAKMDEVSE